MDSFANNLSFKEIKTQIEDIKATYKSIGNTEGIKRINTFMQQLYSSVLANNDAFKSLINTTNESFGEGFATNLQNILLGIKEPISDTEILKNKLKEVEKQLRACGETAKANKIKEFMQETQKKTIDVDSSINELRADIEKCFGTDAVNDFNKKLNETDNKVKSVSKGSSFGSNLKTALGIGTVALGIRKTVGFLKDATTESVDFVETQNLFNVSMGKTVDQYGKLDDEASKYYTKAITFQEKLSDKLGINIEESMNYQALFNAMSKSMGIASDKAYLLSENFTKLGYDLSSLYNIDPENAMQKLRAGLSGQTKPLRDLGLDITQQSLEPLLDELGIERSVKQLSQAEKMIARYIVVLRQASLAHGDFAETMDSPANQLRIFNAQLVAFKRNMGNLWQGLLGGILPYINAIMMVINELLKMVAKLFGFNIETQNISASVGVDDLADDLGTATGKAKELKKQLMGFDEINNITLPDKTSSGSGASVGGIDQRLLDAMKEYDNMMDKVKSKATDIKNQIMKWLGFTGDTEKDLQKVKKWLDRIKDITKIIGIAIGTWKVSSTLTNFLKKLGVINKTNAFKMAFGITLAITGIFAQYKGTQHLLDGDMDIFNVLEMALGTAGGAFGIASILKATKFGKTLSLGQQVKFGLGIMFEFQSIQIAYDSMKKLSEGTLETKEAIQQLTLSIGEGAGAGALTGSIFGLKGAIIGGLIGALISAGSALVGYNSSSIELIKRIKETQKSYEDLSKTLNENAISKLTEIENTEQLVNELETLTDSNGKVKDGYESRVSFILNELNKAYGTEYKLIDGAIQKYDDFKKEIKDLIETKKSEILLNNYEEKYKEALNKRGQAYLDLKQVEEEYVETKKISTERIKQLEEEKQSWINAGMYTYANAIDNEIKLNKDNLTSMEETVNSQKKLLDNYNTDIYNYETLQTAIVTDNKELQRAMYDEFTATVEKDNEKIKLSNDQQIEMLTKQSDKYIEIIKNKGDTVTEEEKNMLDTVLKSLSTKLVEQTKTVEDLTDSNIDAWRKLAEGSESIYNEKISQVDEDTRLALETILGKVDINSSEYIKKWQEMASNSKDKYDLELSKLPEDTAQKIQLAVDEINRKEYIANQAGEDVADEIEKGVNTVDTTEAGKQAVNGVATGIDRNKNSWTLLNSIKGLKDNIVGKLKEKLGIHSPSTVMRDMVGKFIPLGIAEGISNNANSVYSSIKELNNGINKGFNVNPNDFKIDTNQFIDYGQISGAIATQSNVNVSSDIEGRIENAIYSAFSNVKIPVEVEATTDEGVIFKKVQVKAREFTMQTGEPAFDY